MFAAIMDFKMSTVYLKRSQILDLLNEAVNIFDDITNKYDVFKVKTKLDANYMIVAGLHDHTNITAAKSESFWV